MDIGLLLPLPLSTRGYLIYQAVGSVIVNGAINFAFAWPMRDTPQLPLLGSTSSVAFDTCLSAVLLSALTVLFGSWFVRRDVRRGVARALAQTQREHVLLRWIPAATPARAFVFAAAFSAVSVPLGIGCLILLGYQQMPFAAFLVFKLLFATILGALVTPLNAARVLSVVEAR